MHRFLLILSAAMLLVACSRQPDARLVRVAEIVSDHPEEALATLDSIAVDSLSSADRHYFNFLTVKARDKAYITHTSDSLILDVIDYYKGTELYPEALYYGGRVYSDLGDYPTAIKYFQCGLDEVGRTTPENITMKGNLLSQTARLLNSLRLYSQAIPYMKESLTLDSLERDTFNLAYDHQLLGAIYMHQDSLTLADNQFKKAVHWAKYLSTQVLNGMQMYRAALKLKQNDIDSAIILIEGVPQNVPTQRQNRAYLNASNIYLHAGELDSAYLYAYRLVHSPDADNQKNGYYNLFSSNLYTLLPKDSIHIYINRYAETIEKHYNVHESQSAIIQNSLYNYQIQQRAREKAEQRANLHIYISIGFVFLILILVILMLILKSRKQALLVSLQSTIIKLEELREVLAENDSTKHTDNLSVGNDIDTLRNKLHKQIAQIKNQTSDKININGTILNSNVYSKLLKYITTEKTIPENSNIWKELEELIHSDSPQFKSKLYELTGNKIKPHDYHLVLLIRCGFTPTQTLTLLGRTKGTISYRRRHIAELIMGEKIDSYLIDDIILKI